MASLKKTEKLTKERYNKYKRISYIEGLELLIGFANIFDGNDSYGLYIGEDIKNEKNELEKYSIILIDNCVKKDKIHEVFLHELLHFALNQLGLDDDEQLGLAEEAICSKFEEVVSKTISGVNITKS